MHTRTYISTGINLAARKIRLAIWIWRTAAMRAVDIVQRRILESATRLARCIDYFARGTRELCLGTFARSRN
jgi:hypothetical protein